MLTWLTESDVTVFTSGLDFNWLTLCGVNGARSTWPDCNAASRVDSSGITLRTSLAKFGMSALSQNPLNTSNVIELFRTCETNLNGPAAMGCRSAYCSPT